MRGVRSGDRLTIVLAAALACLATLVISPLSWGHYYVIWLPAAVLCPGMALVAWPKPVSGRNGN